MPNMPQTPEQMMDTARREAGVDIDDSAILPAVRRLVDSIEVLDGRSRLVAAGEANHRYF